MKRACIVMAALAGQNPAGYSIDSDHARKTMYFGKAAVDAGATFDGPRPAGAQTVVGRGGFGGVGARGGGAGPPPAARETKQRYKFRRRTLLSCYYPASQASGVAPSVGRVRPKRVDLTHKEISYG